MAQSLETLWTVLARDTVAVDAARALADAGALLFHSICNSLVEFSCLILNK